MLYLAWLTMKDVRTFMHRSLTALMVVWLSGVVFLFCCQNTKAASAMADSCPMAKSHSHCDKAGKTDGKGPFIDASTPVCLQCAFLPVVFDKSRKVEVVRTQVAEPAAAVAVKTFRLPVMAAAINVLASPFQTRVADRHGTYVRNCVFRI